ncbi:serine/threonine-protein kinase [Streptomyces sp. NPDC048507]|uniref:serine/threonine-protein kinase n=1 Tax=Streptomyces sp. NPDC048507 TaxID=3365560 RepID=UPI003723FA98
MEALRDSDPAHIGAHALLARLGAGGMGQVYLGRSPGGRLVAVKVIRDEITGHPEALARFRREAGTIRAVRSAYTANLIDASLAEPPFWIATEYVAGPTLAHAVGRGGALPAATCRRLFAALAEGLGSVHAYGVTHRDLKPQNVILGAQGPQLIDFGIARGVGDTVLTQDGQAPGTPGYTAPEVLLGAVAGAAADVFALGATLAYAATGRPPFGGGPAAGVGYRAVHEPVDLAGVEPELAALIGSCVAKDPAARPAPAEVVRRCGVRDALVDDPLYAGLGVLGEAVPLHEMRTRGPGLPSPSPSAPSPSGSGWRRTVVRAAAGTALALVAAVAVWRLPSGGGGGAPPDGAKGPAAGARAGAPGAGGTPSPVAPPVFIRQTAPNFDAFDPTLKSGGCTTTVDETPRTAFAISVTTAAGDPVHQVAAGTVEIGYRVKQAPPDMPPYYVAVVVKPRHEVGPDGRSTAVTENRQLGFVAEARNVYAGVGTKWKYVTYPDDFSMLLDGKRVKAPPLAQDPGAWTVVFRHATSDTDHKSVWCTGFDSGP